MSLFVSELNSNLTCKLCHGYLINATTVVDCFHSFCKSCLLKHLEKTNKCPNCKFTINKDELVANLKHDAILQSLVYKIVPNLYSNENERRTNFYKEHPQDRINNELDKFRQERLLLNPNELIDISIEYLPECKTNQHPLALANDGLFKSNAKRRYLRVECGMKVSHLRKWIRNKMDLPANHQVVILFNNELLDDSFKMIDLAYIFPKMSRPLNLYYYYYKIPNGKKKIKLFNTTLLKSTKLKNCAQAPKLAGRTEIVNKKCKMKDEMKQMNKGKNLLNNLNHHNEHGDRDKLPVRRQVANGRKANLDASADNESTISKIRKLNANRTDRSANNNGKANGNKLNATKTLGKVNSSSRNDTGCKFITSTLSNGKAKKRFMSSDEHLNKVKKQQVSKNYGRICAKNGSTPNGMNS